MHGGDLATEDPKDEFDRFAGELREKYELKVGPGLAPERKTTKKPVYPIGW